MERFLRKNFFLAVFLKEFGVVRKEKKQLKKKNDLSKRLK